MSPRRRFFCYLHQGRNLNVSSLLLLLLCLIVIDAGLTAKSGKTGNGSDLIPIATSQPTMVSMPLVSIAFVVPHQNLTNAKVREEIRRFFISPTKSKTPKQSSSQSNATSLKTSSRVILPRFQVNPVYLSKISVGQAVKNVFCSDVSRAINALLVIVDKKIQTTDEAKLAKMIAALASDAGIPSMVWSSGSYEVEEALLSESKFKRIFLLGPTIRDQTLALVGFLKLQSLQPYSVIVSMKAPGTAHFLRVLGELKDSVPLTDDHEIDFRSWLTHIGQIAPSDTVTGYRKNIRSELLYVRDTTHARTIVLWATAEEGAEIVAEARVLGMTSESYLWIGGQPLIPKTPVQIDKVGRPVGVGNPNQLQVPYPPGTVVTTYDDDVHIQTTVIKAAVEMWTRAVRKLVALPTFINSSEIAPDGLCSNDKQKPWRWRNVFSKFLLDAKNELSNTSLAPCQVVKFMYLDGGHSWHYLGKWSEKGGFFANESAVDGWTKLRGLNAKTDKTVIKIVTLEEPPYIIYNEPTHGTSCPNKGVLCELSPFKDISHPPVEFEKHENYSKSLSEVTDHESSNETHYACCSGLCIDLLERLAKDIGFRYHLFEVRDRKWGVRDKITGEWNGLISTLINREADVALTSLKINQERSEAIDFTLPFLETGITIMVAVRQGAISPMAILEPISPGAWFAILFGCVNAVMLASYFFETLSFRQNKTLPQPETGRNLEGDQQYSLASSMWLCWAMLFKAAVKVDLPTTLGAKILTGVWAVFCVIFLSSYMANLAAFMIAKDEFYDFHGIDDYRLKNPYTKNPPYIFATIASGATEAFIKKNYPNIYEYMRPYNQSSSTAGILALKTGKIDAFIYDATVLDYKSNHDENCELTTVGKWAAMTGYGIGFPRGSQWLPVFDKYIVSYQYNGFMQQLSEYWLSGACRYQKKQETNKSYQLGILNFTSAWVLLLFGIALCSIVLFGEFLISRYLSDYVIAKQVAGSQNLTGGLSKMLAPKDKKSLQGGDMFRRVVFNSFIMRCTNCGGRGHVATACPSHPDLHLLLKNTESRKSIHH